MTAVHTVHSATIALLLSLVFLLQHFSVSLFSLFFFTRPPVVGFFEEGL